MAITRKSVLMPLVLALVWVLWCSANLVGAALKGPDALAWAVRSTPIYSAYAFLISGLMCWVYDRIQPRPSFWGFAMFVPLLCFVAAAWCELLTGLTRWRLDWYPAYRPTLQYLVVIGFRDGVFLGLFSGIYFAIDHGLQAGEQREKARAATTLAQQAQLQMLRYQINPHFLFNALNSIRAMILENPVRAREITTELSEFLRYSLDGCGTESTIADEIAAIENYLAIQRIRFEHKLDVTVQVDPDARTSTVPCFLVHPLVENAVKYGMDTSPLPLRIEIVVTQCDDELIIRVSNTGKLVPPPASHGTGTGLRNVTQRLALTFADRQALSLVERDGWVHAEIRVHRPRTETALHHV